MIDRNEPIYGERLTHKSLSAFLKLTGLPYSTGNKDAKIEAINNAIINKVINESDLKNWKEVNLLYEGNKHVYIIPHEGYNNHDITNELNKLNNKDVHYYEQEPDKTTLILKEKKYKAKYSSITGELENAEETYYFVIIEVLSDVVVIYIDIPTYLYNEYPPTKISNSEELSVTETKIIIDYKKEIESIFNIRYNENRVNEYVDVLNYLWNSINDSITKELEPYTNEIVDDTLAYISHCMTKLNLLSSKEELNGDYIKEVEQEQLKQNLLDQIISLWQYSILEKTDKTFEFENKYGKIINEKFQNKNGSTVKISSQDRPIHKEALHYNVKGTIKNIQKYGCKQLKFTWLSPTKLGDEIMTILEVNRNYFSIFFTRNYDKEEIQYVLSTIGEIKDTV